MKKIIAFAFVILSTINLYGSDLKNWEVSLYVYEGSSQNRLQAGIRDGATDGYDLLWDSVALLSSNPFNAYFYHPDWNTSSPFFWRDIKAFDVVKEWNFTVNSTMGVDALIVWDLTYVPVNEISLKLIDTENPDREIDMLLNNNYSFKSTGIRNFKLIARVLNYTTPSELLIVSDEPSLQSILTGPPAPSNVTVNPGNGAKVIRWDKVKEAVSYNVYRSADGYIFVRINSQPVLKEMYVDQNSERADFLYAVTAVDIKGFESRYGE